MTTLPSDEEIRAMSSATILAKINQHRNAREIDLMERYFAESERRALWQRPGQPMPRRCPTCGRINR